MFDFLTTSANDAIGLLKTDHNTVKDLFLQFEKSDDGRTKKRIAAEAIMELKIHAEIEEKIFYPSIRKKLDKQIMNEADEEHHVAKFLIAELEQMGSSEDHWEAKFKVLAENVRHHIKEEEDNMFPKAQKLDLDWEAVGQELLALKEELKRNGVPPSPEEDAVALTKKAQTASTKSSQGSSEKGKSGQKSTTGEARKKEKQTS